MWCAIDWTKSHEWGHCVAITVGKCNVLKVLPHSVGDVFQILADVSLLPCLTFQAQIDLRIICIPGLDCRLKPAMATMFTLTLHSSRWWLEWDLGEWLGQGQACVGAKPPPKTWTPQHLPHSVLPLFPGADTVLNLNFMRQCVPSLRHLPEYQSSWVKQLNM